MSEDKVAKENDTVKVDYTGKLDDGSVFDTSEGKAPIEFKIGEHKVIKGFEEGVLGMAIGEEKDVKIAPDEGYGQRNDQLQQTVPLSSFEGKVDPKEGMVLALKAPTGQVIPAKILKIEGDNVTIDLNHPLAGQNLNFHIKLVEIK